MNTKTSKVLIFGFSGQLATALRKRFTDATFLSRAQADLLHPECIEHVLNHHKPSLIINAAAYTAVDLAEKEQDHARLVNVGAVGVMARWAARHNAHLIHFSTDYVFDGAADHPYQEDETKNPINFYGLTKSDGEEQILDSKCSHQILRVSWVYSPWGQNFVKTMLRLGCEKEELKIVADQVGAPTSAEDIADVVVQISKQPEKNGIFHYCGQGEVSWHGFAEEIFRQARTMGYPLKVQLISPIKTTEFPTLAKRPLNSRLSSEKFEKTFGIQKIPWQKSLERTLHQMKGALT
jgi:dTDP-4-dehydrorhamnose reductase